MNKLGMPIFSLILIASCTGNEVDDSPSNKLNRSSNDIILESFEKSSSEVLYQYDEEEEFVIADIKDASIYNNRFFIIDGKNPAVIELSEKGDLIQEFGQSGRGPGEYENPITLAIANNDLFLLDKNLARITQYDSNENEVKSSGSHDMIMSDMCIANGEIWVHSSYKGNVIHQISNSLKEVEKSIGELYDADEMIQQEISSDGRLVCDDEFIYSGFVTDNKIQVYSKKDGILHEQFEFEEIKPLKISLINRDGQRTLQKSYYVGKGDDEKGDYHDVLKEIIKVDEGLLVQYQRNYESAESDTSFFVSISINLNNKTYSITKSLPRIYHYNDGEFILGSNYPLPHIQINSMQN